jgi:hypothetical protein
MNENTENKLKNSQKVQIIEETKKVENKKTRSQSETLRKQSENQSEESKSRKSSAASNKSSTGSNKSGKKGQNTKGKDQLGKLPVIAPHGAVKTKRSQSVPFLQQSRVCGWPVNMQGIPQMQGMPQTQGVPQTQAQMQEMPQLQAMLQMQGMPPMQGMPQMQLMPQMMPQMQGSNMQVIPGTNILSSSFNPQTFPHGFIPIQTNPAQLQAQIAFAAAQAAANAVGSSSSQAISPTAHMNFAAAEFVPRIGSQNTSSVTTNPLFVPTITNIPNGRVLTSMNIRLNPSQGKSLERNTKKLDLTGRRHTIAVQEPVKFNVKIDNEPTSLSSSPRSESELKPMNVQKYSRNYLMSLRENKMSLQLPNLPNIPELLTISKTPAFNGNNHHQKTPNKAHNPQSQYKYRGRYDLQQK